MAVAVFCSIPAARQTDLPTMSALNVDLKRLDCVVITHRHNDHTAGLNQVLRACPSVHVDAPVEASGFNSATPPPVMNLIRRFVASVPDDLRYFGGNVPPENRSGSPWIDATFVQITEPKEILPGFVLFSQR